VPPNPNPIAEGERLLTICNACRYCEGFCAVFPAMERRLTFTEADLNYLANLCHNCAECYYACQYAPPHEFSVNVPKALAEIREHSYRMYSWPRALRLGAWWALAIGLIVAILLARGRSAADADFYAVISHRAMVATFGVVAVFVLIAHLAGFARFWSESGEGFARFLLPAALAKAIRDVLSLTNLSSGGAGCTYPDHRHSQARRVFHHFTFYGFQLCFASTTTAAIYHYLLGLRAPYGYASLPVLLGTLGGLGLLIGPVGLYALKRRRDPAIADPKQDPMDVSFLALLFFSSLTGLLLLVLRETAGMGWLLTIHLGVVLGFFLTLPYGKFVHGIYRSAALVRSALEAARR
jgi:citrate/tricarballylate utilization protein